MSRAFITGICSFTGRHLTASLQSLGGYDVFGCDMAPNAPPRGAEVELGDVRNRDQLARLLRAIRPQTIYHLAASANEFDPTELVRTNVEGTWHLLDACRQLDAPPKVLLVGSSASFGEMPPHLAAWPDNAATCPSSFYGWSRASQLDLGRTAFEKWTLPVYLCRPFNLIGPGLSERFAPAALARRVLDLKQPGGSRFPLCNAQAIRDFVDVRDAVRAYHAILDRGQPALPYNVGSGTGVTIRFLVERLAHQVGLCLQIEDEPISRTEARSPIQRSVADITRIQRDTGWQSNLSFDQSLRDMLDYQASDI